MKNLRKTLSAFLTVALLASFLVLPVTVNAATGMAGGTMVEQTLPFADDFSANNDNFNGTAKIDGGVMSFYKGAEHATWKLKNRVNINGSIMEMSLDIKAKTGNYLKLSVMDYQWWTDMQAVLEMQSGSFTVNEKSASFVNDSVYHVVIKFLPKTGEMNVRVFNPDGSLLLSNNLNKYYQNGLQTFVLQGGWDSETEIVEVDNLSMVDGGEVWFSEDFSGVSTPEELAQEFIFDNNQTQQVVDLGGARGKVVALTGNLACGLNVRFAGSFTSGKYTASFKFQPNNEWYTFQVSNSNSFSGEVTSITADNKVGGVQLTRGEWYTFTALVDLDGDVIKSCVTDSLGGVVWSGTKAYTDGFKNFAFRGGWDSTEATQFDDILIRVGDFLPDFNTIYKEEFTEMTTDDLGSNFAFASGIGVTVEEEKLKHLNSTGYQSFTFNGKSITENATLSMDVTWGGPFWEFYAEDISMGSVQQLSNGGAMCTNGSATFTATQGATYKLNVYFNLTEKKATAQWLDTSGAVLAESTVNYDKTVVKGFKIHGGWHGPTDGISYFDNLTAKKGNYLAGKATNAQLVSFKEGEAAVTVGNTAAGDTLTLKAKFKNTNESAMSLTYYIGYYDAYMNLKTAQVIQETGNIKTGLGTLSHDIIAPDMTDVAYITAFIWDDNLKAWSTPISI